jgi:hypothetical protein
LLKDILLHGHATLVLQSAKKTLINLYFPNVYAHTILGEKNYVKMFVSWLTITQMRNDCIIQKNDQILK